MHSKVFSGTLHGIDAKIITVETDIAHGLHYFHIVGLPDKSVEESKDRVNSALKNSGFDWPKKTNQKNYSKNLLSRPARFTHYST